MWGCKEVYHLEVALKLHHSLGEVITLRREEALRWQLGQVNLKGYKLGGEARVRGV